MSDTFRRKPEIDKAQSRTSPDSRMSRRDFLKMVGAGTVTVATGELINTAFAKEPKELKNNKVEIPDNLPTTTELTKEEKEVALEAGAVLSDDDLETRDAYFYGVSVMMGLGIAVDVAAATLAMYRKLDSTKAKATWIVGVGASHIILPVLSGIATASAEKGGTKIGLGDVAQRGLSAAGFVILSKFLYGEIKGEPEGEEEREHVDIIESFDVSKLQYLAAIWSVSVDAAISGPAKWSQAKTAGWGRNDILTSIAIGGLTVSLVAALALKGADMLHKKYGREGSEDVDNALEKWDDPLLAIEALALNYFGVNALINGTFKIDLNPSSIAGLDAAFTAAMFAVAKSLRAKDVVPATDGKQN